MTARSEQPDFPWWLVVLGAAGLWLCIEVWSSPVYAKIMAERFVPVPFVRLDGTFCDEKAG